MKKVLVIGLALIMIVSMSLTAMAASGAFVSSPSGAPAPGIITVKPGHDDCPASVIITPFADRFDLPDEFRTLFEKAYEQIANVTDLTDLVAGLKDLADRLNIYGNQLGISDFFYLYATGCGYQDDSFEVTLDADTLDRFVGLIQMNKDGKWELVSNAQVVRDGQYLKFSVDSFAPLAIVVDTSKGSLIAPQTGYGVLCASAIVMVASAAALAFVLIKRKQEA